MFAIVIFHATQAWGLLDDGGEGQRGGDGGRGGIMIYHQIRVEFGRSNNTSIHQTWN